MGDNDLVIGQNYMCDNGICVYTGIEEEKNRFEFKGLKWLVPKDSPKHFMETLFSVTRWMDPEELDKLLVKGELE